MLKSTKVPDAAFKALTAMVASPELLTIYGAMPADPAQQDAWFKSIDANFPGIKLDWTIAAGNARLPGHPQPPVLRAELRQGQGRLAGLPEQGTGPRPGVDIDAELATLKTTLQGIFDKPAK